MTLTGCAAALTAPLEKIQASGSLSMSSRLHANFPPGPAVCCPLKLAASDGVDCAGGVRDRPAPELA